MKELKDRTAEDRRDAATYGVCVVCRAPRRPQYVEIEEDGETIHTYGIYCPNGHPQDPRPPLGGKA